MTSPVSIRLPTLLTQFNEKSEAFNIRTKTYQDILLENPFFHDTPQDGSCMLWSFLLAYFTVSINDKEITFGKFIHIFQDKLLPYSFDEFHKLLSTYDGKKLHGNEQLQSLIIKSLRTTIVDKMITERQLYEPFVATDCSFEKYITSVLDHKFWCGDSEIRALSDAFSIPICATHSQYKTAHYFGLQYQNDNEILYLHNMQVNVANSNETANHFQFLFNKELVETPLEAIPQDDLNNSINDDLISITSDDPQGALSMSAFYDDEDLFPTTLGSHQETLSMDNLYIEPPKTKSSTSFEIPLDSKPVLFNTKLNLYLQKELLLQASNYLHPELTQSTEMPANNLSPQKFLETTTSTKIALKTFPYPCDLPTSQNSLLWSFIFGHFSPSIRNQEMTNAKLDSIFGFGFCSSEGSEFKDLLENFDLRSPEAQSLSEYIKDRLEDYITNQLRSLDQKEFTNEEKQKFNDLLRNSKIECDFTSKLYFNALSSEFEIPIVLIKEDGKTESFGVEHTSKTPPICIERFALNESNKSYQYAPRLAEAPQTSSLISDKTAFAIVQKLGATKALELYPQNETIFRYSLLRISEIFPGTKLFKMTTTQLINLFIAKVGARKAISMFPSRFEVVHPAIAKAPELFQSLDLDAQQDLRLASIYVNKVGIETALNACPQSFAVKQLLNANLSD